MRLLPNDKLRQLYSIRGVVEKHDTNEYEIPIISIRINKKQLAVFNATVKVIPPVIKLGMTEEKWEEKYPVGAEIGITFGLANAADQFFAGADQLKVMNLQAMGPGVQLRNEVSATA